MAAAPEFVTRQLTCTVEPACHSEGVPITDGTRSARGAVSMTTWPGDAAALLPSAVPSSTVSGPSATTIAKAGVGPIGAAKVTVPAHVPAAATVVPWKRVATSASAASSVASAER